MARDSKATGHRSILVAVGVLILIALFALWRGNNTDDGNAGPTIPVAEEVSPPATASVPAETTDSAKASTPSPSRSQTSFIPQDDLASIPPERFFTTSGMNGLTPLAPETTFGAGEPVYVYAGIHAPTNERIQLRWFGPDGGHILPSIYKNILANTGDVGYRIYTYRIFREAGPYQVVLYNSAGTVIGETRFEVVEK